MAATRIIGTTLTLTTFGKTPIIVGTLTSLGEPGLTREELETTTFNSQNDFREFIGTWKDAGELSFEGIVKDNTTVPNLWNVTQDGDVDTWELEFPTGQKWFFAGFIKEFREGDMEVSGVRTFRGSIRISGEPVYAESGISA